MPADYNGAYVGSAMTWQDPEGSMAVSASTTVTQTGQTVFFGTMSVTSPTRRVPSYPMGPATLSGNAFNHTMEFVRPGCGLVTNHYWGHFSADGDDLTVTRTWIASGCAHAVISGEMRRVRP